ncbi:MAG: NAD(P)/FAD-dependent oxidoreductase [Deltaproteobacteria bacterium]|nr:NAD(P)/FAD-dependent oxidoreductase [Deltaproteobacteria bacterium]
MSHPGEYLDVLIIGGGPAGLAAAIMVNRARLGSLVLESNDTGGTLRTARWVENYPGFANGIEGWELAQRIVNQADRFNVIAYREKVTGVRKEPGGFRVISDMGERLCKVVIAAYGANWKSLGIPGEEQVMGIRLFNTIVQIQQVAGGDLSGKRVFVIGAGDVAVDQSLALFDRGAKVTILVRGSRLKSASHLERQVKRSRVKVLTDVTVQAMDLSSSSLLMEVRQGERVYQEAVDAALACVGRYTDFSILPTGLGSADHADAWGATDVPGLFLAGDLRRGADRHTAIAVGDGQAAALAAIRYIRGTGDK